MTETGATRIAERTGGRSGDGGRGHEIRLSGGGRGVGRGRGASRGLEGAGGTEARIEMGGRGGIGRTENGRRVGSGIGRGEVCSKQAGSRQVRTNAVLMASFQRIVRQEPTGNARAPAHPLGTARTPAPVRALRPADRASRSRKIALSPLTATTTSNRQLRYPLRKHPQMQRPTMTARRCRLIPTARRRTRIRRRR